MSSAQIEMSTDDIKPFACTSPGCTMRFTNEDHLTVHMKKHDMSLALNTEPNWTPANNVFVDQTPTPTKFLRNCEEIGLFQELSKNPFEEAFKKAGDVPSSSSVDSHSDVVHIHTIPIPGPDSDVLHTPTVPGVVKHEARSRPISKLADKSRDTNQRLSQTSSSSTDENVGEVGSSVKQEPSATLSLCNIRNIPRIPSVIVTESCSDHPSSTTPDEDDDVLIVSTSHTDSPPSVVMIEDSPSTTCHPSPLSIITPESSVSISSSPVIAQPQYTMQVLLQLPNGQTVPVLVPTAIPGQTPLQQVAALLPASVVSTPQASLSSKSISMVTSSATTQTPIKPLSVTMSGPQPSFAKQKLKAVLQQSAQLNALNKLSASLSGPSAIVAMETTSSSSSTIVTIVPSSSSPLSSSSNTPPPNVAPVTCITPPPDMMLVDDTPDDFTEMDSDEDVGSPDSDSSMAIKRLRKDDDPDERRRKFLERNRAAAARCRMKRKQWIVDLEKKADDLQNKNNTLQGEVTTLRNEICVLKTLLLAHKDCPITLQQQSQGHVAIETIPAPREQHTYVISAPVILPAETVIAPAPPISIVAVPSQSHNSLISEQPTASQSIVTSSTSSSSPLTLRAIVRGSNNTKSKNN